MSASARAADRIAADWQDVVDAVRKAGGDAVVISALDLSLLLTGFADHAAVPCTAPRCPAQVEAP